jgi:membrane-bound lytic murein transglycosylase B
VPREILVAIWGDESNYGEATGTFNLFEALATLAYDGPRMDFGRREFLAALKMVEKNHYKPAAMTASWAGAFGQTQFVPSSFLAHAVDGDGDGIVDIWNSPADALASTAALLADAGWKRGSPCGYEVSLPSGFDYGEADLELAKPLTSWKAIGVRTAVGAELSVGDGNAAIFLPAGARGPAFLVFDNFKTILKYNNAGPYALAICTLAARLRGNGQIKAPWPRDEQPLSADERSAFQTALKALGFDPGAIDGVLGRGTRAALRAYQKAHGLVADGFPTKALLTRLMAESGATS